MASASNIYNPSNKGECVEAVRLIHQERVIALDLKSAQLGNDGPLTLLQIGTIDGRVYLFDIMRNERDQDKTFFKDTGLDALLTCPHVVKVNVGCSWDSVTLFNQFGIKLESVFDPQLADVLIQEHKGKKLPRRKQRADICKIYSDDAKVYEEKEEFKHLPKKEGNFWTKRPLTQQMIECASENVTVLIPEVYQNQKRFLEENDLIEEFNERVKELVGFYIDPLNKEGYNQRVADRKRGVLIDMARKYRSGVTLADVDDEDERRALRETKLRDIYASYPELIRNLKHESCKEFLKSLENDMNDQETFIPRRRLYLTLNEISGHAETEEIEKEAKGIREKFVAIVISDINRKYNKDTPLCYMFLIEKMILKSLRPLLDVGEYPATVLALHWKVIEKELDEDIERREADPDHKVKDVKKLKRFVSDPRVPDGVKAKATKLHRNERATYNREPRFRKQRR